MSEPTPLPSLQSAIGFASVILQLAASEYPGQPWSTLKDDQRDHVAVKADELIVSLQLRLESPKLVEFYQKAAGTALARRPAGALRSSPLQGLGAILRRLGG
jgi:hypothetical protein